MPTLFDQSLRTDPTPARNQEGSFAFLNRVATPWWSRVRNLLEIWFAAYCEAATPEKAADLRGRFRSRDGRQHFGASWELYVFSLLRALHPDKSIDVEPERPGFSGRPDFCVAPNSDAAPELWVEAVTNFGFPQETGRHAAREAYVLDAINEIRSRDFRVYIGFVQVGETQPRKRELIDPVRSWLEALDRDDVIAASARGERRPRKTLKVRGWEITLEALPKGTPGIHPNDRLIGIGPISVGWTNDVAEARAAIERKSRGYGDVGAPLVIALLPSSPTFDLEDAAAALYGSEGVQVNAEAPTDPRVVRLADGAWARRDGRASAVLFGARVLPWTVATTWPQLWLNPYAVHPLGDRLTTLPTVKVGGTGTLETRPPRDDAPARLLGLDLAWPGPGEPFAP